MGDTILGKAVAAAWAALAAYWMSMPPSYTLLSSSRFLASNSACESKP